MFCNQCGLPAVANFSYCPQCGARVVPPVAPSPHAQPADDASPDERLRKARVLVGLACTFAGAVSLASLPHIAAGIAVVALIIFAFAWSSREIGYRKKFLFVLSSLILIATAAAFETMAANHRAIENKRKAEEAAAKSEEAIRLAAQQGEYAFKSMTPTQHLSAAQTELHVGVSDDQIADGIKHLDALHGTALESRAEAVRTRYEAEKARAEKAQAAAAARQEKEDAALQEVSRETYAKTLENNLLGEDMEVDVKAVGPHHTTLEVTWALASKVFAYKISQSEEFQHDFQDMRSLGFKKFVVTNGLDMDEETWTWNL